jgi:ribosome-binding factor A
MSKTESIKQLQAASMIQREMSTIVRNEGPLLYGNVMTTITRVRMTPDLALARIYVSVFTPLNKEVVVDILNQHKSQMRWELGKRIGKQVRHVPEIEFYIDETLDEMDRIDELFAKINDPK